MDTHSAHTLVPRLYGYGYGYGYGNYNSTWSRWGRWVLLGALIIAVLAIYFLFSCLSARKRRKNGYSPYRGTGWVLGKPPPGHGQMAYTSQPQYGNQTQPQQPYYNNSNNPPPPPAYTSPPTNGSNGDYYGNQPGIELQQPGATYQGYNRDYEGAYAPPKDPPPRK